jgi:hypothetical protein
MSCELFDVDLKLMGFSDEPGCIYERFCPFANSININKVEVSESCQALNDIKNEGTATIEDAEQDIALQNQVCIKRVN